MKRSLAPMAAWTAATWMAAALYGIAVTALLTRSVGLDGFGLWATIAAARSFMVFLDGGLATGVARDVALAEQGASDATGRVRAATRLYGLLALGALAVSGLAGELVGVISGRTGEAANTAISVTRLVGLEAAVALAAGVLPAILRGRQRFDALGVVTLAQTALGLALLPWMLQRWGIAGAAGAALAARVMVSLGAFTWMKANGLLRFETSDNESDHRPIRGLLRYAGPLWVAAIGAQLGLITDVPIVAWIYGDAASGAFATGARLPAAGAALLFAILASAFPRMVTATAMQRRRMSSSLLCLACVLATAGFGFMVFHAGSLLTLLIGSAAPPLAVQVLWIYALAWTLNAPAHVLSSMAIALGRHRVLAAVVLVEAIANLALSLVLASAGSATGPAIATLITLFVSNVLVLPPILLRRLEIPWSSVLRPCVFGVLTGSVIAALASYLSTALCDSPLSSMAVALTLTLLGVAAVLECTVRSSSVLQHIWALTKHRGWRVLRAQAAQIASEGSRLADLRTSQPILWIPTEPPLVTVRIATYNRGPLVAERSIASAIRQTHENLEILVVGDHCDRATADAVLSVRDPRVRFINLPERGKYPANPTHRWMVAGSAPMNHALDVMRGEWIAPLDDDDEFTEDHVEVLLDACRQRQLEFAYGIAAMEDAAGGWTQCGAWPLAHGQIIHAAVLYSSRLRRFSHDLQSWRLNQPGDWNLWQRLRRAGVPMGFVDRVVASHYREGREIADDGTLWRGRSTTAESCLDRSATRANEVVGAMQSR